MGIKYYTINSQGEIDVDGNVYLNDKKFKELPFKFGKINGWFNLGGSKNLTSLKNCPDYVGDYFSCSFCLKLDSLEGCPKEVKGNFNCSYCSQLDSLEGCPKKVGGHFNCIFCSQLDSLEGCPKKVGGQFKCGDCKRDFTKEEVQSLCAVKKNNIFVWNN